MSVPLHLRLRRRWLASFVVLLLSGLAAATLAAQRGLPDSLDPVALDGARPSTVLDRHGQRLTLSYQARWNTEDWLPLEQVPAFLRVAIVEAEDRRYWSHAGIDWRARLGAVWQDLRARRAVRGASTISEQAVRLLHPRPRSLWSRWVEGFEALRLEARFSKSEILEFYVNEVPYGANRRGVAQAARWSFGRELATLSEPEMLALAVMPRAPSRLDPALAPQRLAGPIERLLARLQDDGLIDAVTSMRLAAQPPLALAAVDDTVPAAAFVAEVRARLANLAPGAAPARIRSSLDAPLQREAQRLLDSRVQDLASAGVRQGGLLVVDLDGNRARAWAVANRDDDTASGQGIDTVQVPRQPGSALKPFVYALALESGWTAATLIEDEELSAHVGDGLHPYRNYSRLHYGAVTVREALGNSLNIPAVKALQFVGGERLLTRLRRLGMSGLTAHPDWYGDGLALGNGEVTLLQLVQGYAALANAGRAKPITLFEEPVEPQPEDAVYSRESASLIGDILSDSRARQLEFGRAGLLRFPAQTAVKTGTSSDYRDAWCVAYDRHHVVGAWMGNLTGREMDGVTGSIGPALLVRSVFGLLAQRETPGPLYRSPLLEARSIRDADGGERSEWFLPGTAPQAEGATSVTRREAAATPQLAQPFEGLRVAFDPRIPATQQALAFRLDAAAADARVRWVVDAQPVAETATPEYLWPLARGEHSASAEDPAGAWRTATVRFRVK